MIKFFLIIKKNKQVVNKENFVKIVCIIAIKTVVTFLQFFELSLTFQKFLI